MIGNTSSGLSYHLGDLTSYACAAGILLHRNGNYVFGRKVLFSTDPHYQFLDVSQDMRETHLCLFYPLSQVRWDRCVQQSHQILYNLVREHHLYSGK